MRLFFSLTACSVCGLVQSTIAMRWHVITKRPHMSRNMSRRLPPRQAGLDPAPPLHVPPSPPEPPSVPFSREAAPATGNSDDADVDGGAFAGILGRATDDPSRTLALSGFVARQAAREDQTATLPHGEARPPRTGAAKDAAVGADARLYSSVATEAQAAYERVRDAAKCEPAVTARPNARPGQFSAPVPKEFQSLLQDIGGSGASLTDQTMMYKFFEKYDAVITAAVNAAATSPTASSSAAADGDGSATATSAAAGGSAAAAAAAGRGSRATSSAAAGGSAAADGSSPTAAAPTGASSAAVQSAAERTSVTASAAAGWSSATVSAGASNASASAAAEGSSAVAATAAGTSTVTASAAAGRSNASASMVEGARSAVGSAADGAAHVSAAVGIPTANGSGPSGTAPTATNRAGHGEVPISGVLPDVAPQAAAGSPACLGEAGGGSDTGLSLFSGVFKAANAMRNALRDDLDDAVRTAGWKRFTLTQGGVEYVIFFRLALDVSLRVLKGASKVQLRRDDAEVGDRREHPIDGEALQAHQEAIHGLSDGEGFVLGVYVYSDATLLSWSGAHYLYPVRIRVVHGVTGVVEWHTVAYVSYVHKRKEPDAKKKAKGRR
eukprot:TRINITY_DN6751_c0_g1_i1.p2 TRINITY_DN6751_c0_g1~~TRINITY_DN6751_c0_g1_i1.p2  ORF type:complete len:611 (-),score=89.82 TRINITY_DN6751_c0_g1_i1:465-2297(-)